MAICRKCGGYSSYKGTCKNCKQKWRDRRMLAVDQVLAEHGLSKLTDIHDQATLEIIKKQVLKVERKLKREERGS